MAGRTAADRRAARRRRVVARRAGPAARCDRHAPPGRLAAGARVLRHGLQARPAHARPLPGPHRRRGGRHGGGHHDRRRCLQHPLHARRPCPAAARGRSDRVDPELGPANAPSGAPHAARRHGMARRRDNDPRRRGVPADHPQPDRRGHGHRGGDDRRDQHIGIPSRRRGTAVGPRTPRRRRSGVRTTRRRARLQGLARPLPFRPLDRRPHDPVGRYPLRDRRRDARGLRVSGQPPVLDPVPRRRVTVRPPARAQRPGLRQARARRHVRRGVGGIRDARPARGQRLPHDQRATPPARDALHVSLLRYQRRINPLAGAPDAVPDFAAAGDRLRKRGDPRLRTDGPPAGRDRGPQRARRQPRPDRQPAFRRSAHAVAGRRAGRARYLPLRSTISTG